MQKFRKMILIVSFVLFPLTIYFFSPYLIIKAATGGILAGSGIVFIVQMFTALIFGRGFCGWLCPAGSFQEWAFSVNSKPVTQKLNWIKFLIWGIWLSVMVFLFFKAGGIQEINFLYENENLVSIDQPSKYVIYYGIILFFALMSFFIGKRALCHYGCWMAPFMIIGTKIKNRLNIPSVRIQVKKEDCIACGQCSKKCPMSLDVMQMVKSGRIESTECVFCGECVSVCPKDVLSFYFGFRQKS